MDLETQKKRYDDIIAEVEVILAPYKKVLEQKLQEHKAGKAPLHADLKNARPCGIFNRQQTLTDEDRAKARKLVDEINREVMETPIKYKEILPFAQQAEKAKKKNTGN